MCGRQRLLGGSRSGTMLCPGCCLSSVSRNHQIDSFSLSHVLPQCWGLSGFEINGASLLWTATSETMNPNQSPLFLLDVAPQQWKVTPEFMGVLFPLKKRKPPFSTWILHIAQKKGLKQTKNSNYTFRKFC